MKEKTIYYCKECGNETMKWQGRCPACGQWNTIVEYKQAPMARSSNLASSKLSERVLNMLHRQMAQVLLMTGEDANGQAEWLMKQPKEFIRGVLLGADRQQDAFDDVRRSNHPKSR